ncbi:MAG: hypothetical protein ACI9VR_003904 [Cognaticolwellia sp.]|jgi:hypothetical protein
MLGKRGRGKPVLLALALVLYTLLGLLTVNAIGPVGEVALSWSLNTPPAVLRTFDGQLAAGPSLGPLKSSQVRPLERIEIGPLSLPLAVNTYTGGPPDWPARLAHAVAGQPGAVTIHLLMGALLLVLIHRFLRFHGASGSGGLAALVLAADWSFIFYRKVLGGTEILLMAAGLLLVWSTWSRRWGGGRHGSYAIAVAMGLGLLAKVTFLPTLLAWGLALLLTRNDKPNLKPPPALPWAWLVGIPVLLTSPLWVTWIHHGLAMPKAGHIQSHDFLSLQLERSFSGISSLLSGERAPAREVPSSLLWFLGDPLAWLDQAYGGTHQSVPIWPRLIAGCVLIGGSCLEWLRPREDRSGALLRIFSLFVPLQLLLIWLANRDLHHLAQATPMLAIWFGLAGTRLLAMGVNPRNPLRGIAALILALPLIVPGALALRHTDAAVESGRIPHFQAKGQEALAEMLRRNQVQSLRASDYDLYGMLEIQVPEIRVLHGWGAVSQATDRNQAFADFLRLSTGHHLLLVRPSAPMRYNLSPTTSRLRKAQELCGCTLLLDESLSDSEGEWAWLYRVQPAGSTPLEE